MKNVVKALFALILLFMPFVPAHAADDSKVIVSIKPLYSVVAAIMGNTGTPTLLVDGMQSPHGYQLKPSQVAALEHADVVFYIGPQLETFLTRPLANTPKSVDKIAMMNIASLRILPLRSGGDWEPDADAPPTPPGAAGQDPHIWLDPGNIKMIAAVVTRTLSDMYPQNRATYLKNIAVFMGKLEELNRETKRELAPVRGRPYIVFHDAFHYYEESYGLNAVGSITLEPEQEPGAGRIAAIRAKIKKLNVDCVFSEPEFNSNLVKTVTEGSDARIGVIDPLGAALPAGPDLYIIMMHQIADSFRHCLAS